MSEVVKVQVVADTTSAKQQLQDLQAQLQRISTQPININNTSLVEANKMALELQQNLQKAMNPNTGKLDLRVFSQTLKTQKRDLNDYAAALQRIGPEGQQAFLTLGRTIAMAEAPTSRLNASLIKFGNTIKNTINWQISSSLIHGVMGQIQGALNYAEKLNTSLNNIRIVTGASTEKMADFAKEANLAAKRLSTTTTAYTNASLIYYQQGLGDKEVAARTETTLKLANVSKQSVEEVSNQLTAIWNNYADGADNLQHYADVITALGAATASSSSEIATGLEKFASIGKTVGLSYDYATTALATITAQTRQSADTVGTGLRTLFSRLQSLKLGETLEDGVGLTKYSNALASVGVNIQNQYGKIKDMDQILDELGAKWGTITKEQQIALAQTVGGVRQYTNLIALMDNWGTFQKNLKVAQGADGTLDKQAQIYGQSWEAASKRVKASIETIYNELLNDKAIIKLIDGFAGFLDIIHGITEGLGGMKGILLTVSSIFMSQYAKNIPGVLKGIWGGFKQFTGIGMISTQHGKVDKNTYLMQQQNMGALQAKANDTTASAGDRINARGSLTLAHMNQAYQARKRFMTADQQAAEELRIKNTEASFNSLEAQARKKDEYKSAGEKDLKENLIKAQKEGSHLTAFQRTSEMQAKIDEAKEKAEKDQEEADKENRTASESREIAEKSKEKAAQSKKQAEDDEREAEEAEKQAKEAEAELKEKASGRRRRESAKGIAAREARQKAKEAREKAELSKMQAEDDEREAEEHEAEAVQKEETAKKAEEKAKSSSQTAKDADKTPEELREKAAKELFEKTHSGESYITEEEVKSKKATRAARQAQQEGLVDGLREMHEKEGLLKDTSKTAQEGAKRLDSDVSALDTMRRANWELTQKGKSKEELDQAWAEKSEEERREAGKLDGGEEEKALRRAKDKAAKYKENLEASIDAKYGKDSDEAKALKTKIKEATEKEDGDIQGAKSVSAVAKAAQAIADAVSQAIEEGVPPENEGEGGLLSQQARQQNIETMEDQVSEVTGLSVEELANFGQDVEVGQQGRFGQEMAIQDLNNPLEEEDSEGQDLFGQISTGIGDVAAAAAACAGGLSAVSNAFDVITDSSASFAQKAGAFAGALGSLKNVQGVAQGAAESIAGMVGKVAPPWIGAAIAAGTAIFGVIKGIQERKEAEAAADRKQRMEKADAAKKEADNHKELIESYDKSSTSLQKIVKAYSEGSATSKDISEAQLDLIDKTKELNNAYKLSGTTAMILGNDLDSLNAEIEDARLDEITRNTALSEDALAAARTELLKVGKEAKKTGVTAITHQESEWVDGEYYEQGAIAPSNGWHQVYYDVTDGYSIDMGSKSDTSDEQTALYILNGASSRGHGAITVTQDASGQYTGANLSADAYTDPQKMVELYEDLNEAYTQMNSTMGETERTESEIYQNVKKQIELLAPYVTQYQQYADYIQDYDIEKLALGGASQGGISVGRARERITNLESYIQYRQELIDAAAEANNISKEDTEQYETLVRSVDAYLGTLSYVTDAEQGNLQIISQGLEDITKKQAKLQGKENDEEWANDYRERLLGLYNKYGNAIFELDSSIALKIPLDLDDENIEGRLRTQLDLLQEIAESNRIKVQLELADNFNLTAGSSYSEWAEFGKAVNANQKDISGEEIPNSGLWREIMEGGERDFDVASFSALPEAERQRLMSQYRQGLNDKYFLPGGQFEQEQAARVADLNQAREDYRLSNIYLDEKKQSSSGNFSGSDIYNDRKLFQRRRELIEQDEQGLLDDAGREELAKLNNQIEEDYGALPDETQEQFINNVLDAANAVDSAAASQARANDAVQAGIATQEAYQQIGFRGTLIDEANQWGINYDNVQAYATSLRDVGVFEQDEIERSEEFALAILKKNAAIEEINKNYAEWVRILNDPKLENSEEGLAAVEAMRKAFAELLDLDPKQISKALIDWGKKAGNLQRLAQGNESAWAEVFEIQAKGIIENSNIAIDEIEGLEDAIKELARIAAKYNVGETLSPEDTEKAMALLEQYRAAYKDAHNGQGPSEQQQLDFLESAANIDTSELGIGEDGGLTKTITFDVDLNDADAQAQIEAFLAQNPNLEGTFTITDADGIQVGQQPMEGFVDADGGVDISGFLNSESDAQGHIRFEGTAPTTEIVSKGGGGSGGGGGGGGGGQKKKDHKKPDTGTRYHKIRAKQANNNQNKQEASRKKERAFGAEKIKQAEKEIELQKEALELQRQYVDEINDYLAEDRTKMIEAFTPDKLGFDLGFNLEIDQDGVITNYRQLEEKLLEEENKLIDKYNEGGLDDEAYQEAQKKIDEAREYLKIYEETRDLYEEEWIKLAEYLDDLADSALELTKLKIDLDISISDDTLGLLDYMLEKIEDNAYKAAEAISLLGDKTNETLKRVDIYQSGLEEILNSKGLSLDDLENITDEQLINGDFTQAQIDQIREWRDAILDANKELLQMREDIIDKIIDAFNELNDKVKESYDQFDHYNSIIEDYTNITDLLGVRLNQQQKELIKMLGQAALNNAQTQAAAARTIYETALANQLEAQKAYDAAVANGDTEAMRQWEKIVKETQTVLDEAQQQWLEAWQAALEKAQELYTKAIEDTVKAFEESVSGAFGALDYLQSAFDRMGQTNDQYLQDFEKLYELNKLNRDIQKTIDDSNNIRDKQALKQLQKEINDLQAQGVKLSQYDVDALRKKFELEQARQALEDARNAKSEVRLQRDANGNWGYVYTAMEDEVAEAEQEYENKLYEYQKLNDDYINELQSRVLEAQTTYKDALAEIYNDTTLTDEQRQARIDELNTWLNAELGYFEQQLQNAMKNQEGTLELYYKLYNTNQAELADSWEETTLRMLTGANTLENYMKNLRDATLDMLKSASEALHEYNEDVDETNHMAGVDTEDYTQEVTDAISAIGEGSAKTKEEVAKLSEELQGNFVDSLKAAIDWEEEYAKKINSAVEANEKFIKSINDMIAKLAELESSNPGLEKARTAYQVAEIAHEEYVQEWKRQHPDEDVAEADIIDEAWEKAKAEWQKYLEEIIGISPIYDTGVPQSLKTGGYTGVWNIASAKTGMYTGSWNGGSIEENGKLAFLHEKELVLNKDDTQNFLDATKILRTLDIQTNLFSRGLGNIITPWIGEMKSQALDQNVKIEASFPSVTDHNEIELAFDNLINKASQYANRKNMSSMTFQDMYTSKF